MPTQIQVVRTHSIAKILRDADGRSTVAEKVATLQRHDSNALREVLRHAFEPTIKYDVSTNPLPASPKDYTRATQNNPNLYHPQEDDGTNEGCFYYEVRRRLIYLIEGGPGVALGQDRRDDLFKDILESINPFDADLLLAIKDDQWPFESLTSSVLNEAFPGLISLQAGIAAVAPAKKVAAATKAKAKAKPKKKVTTKKKA